MYPNGFPPQGPPLVGQGGFHPPPSAHPFNPHRPGMHTHNLGPPPRPQPPFQPHMPPHAAGMSLPNHNFGGMGPENGCGGGLNGQMRGPRGMPPHAHAHAHGQSWGPFGRHASPSDYAGHFKMKGPEVDAVQDAVAKATLMGLAANKAQQAQMHQQLQQQHRQSPSQGPMRPPHLPTHTHVAAMMAQAALISHLRPPPPPPPPTHAHNPTHPHSYPHAHAHISGNSPLRPSAAMPPVPPLTLPPSAATHTHATTHTTTHVMMNNNSAHNGMGSVPCGSAVITQGATPHTQGPNAHTTHGLHNTQCHTQTQAQCVMPNIHAESVLGTLLSEAINGGCGMVGGASDSCNSGNVTGSNTTMASRSSSKDSCSMIHNDSSSSNSSNNGSSSMVYNNSSRSSSNDQSSHTSAEVKPAAAAAATTVQGDSGPPAAEACVSNKREEELQTEVSRLLEVLQGKDRAIAELQKDKALLEEHVAELRQRPIVIYANTVFAADPLKRFDGSHTTPKSSNGKDVTGTDGSPRNGDTHTPSSACIGDDKGEGSRVASPAGSSSGNCAGGGGTVSANGGGVGAVGVGAENGNAHTYDACTHSVSAGVHAHAQATGHTHTYAAAVGAGKGGEAGKNGEGVDIVGCGGVSVRAA